MRDIREMKDQWRFKTRILPLITYIFRPRDKNVSLNIALSANGPTGFNRMAPNTAGFKNNAPRDRAFNYRISIFNTLTTRCAHLGDILSVTS